MKMTERQQLLAIVTGAIIALLSLWRFLLTPQYQERQRLENEILQIARSLSDRNLLPEEAPLRNFLHEEEHRARGLAEQWLQTAGRLTGFPDHHHLRREDVGRIDYKAALFDVRERLRSKSRAIGIPLPHALGMADVVTTQEDTRILMLQLRAMERLADLTLDLRIAEIQHIEPLPPVQHTLEGSRQPYLEEYPVRMVFHGAMDNLHALFGAILKTNHVFGFRSFSIDREPEGLHNGHLRFEIILSAFFFLQDADQVTDVSGQTPLRRIPF